MFKMRKLILPLLALALIACRKDNTPPPSPVITDFGVVAQDTTIAIGQKIEFAPKINTNEISAHVWQLDEHGVGNSATYTFDGATAGRHKISYTVTNSTGSATRTLNVAVKRYVGGVYIVNEGWFGHDKGSVNHFDPTSGKLTERVYKTNNQDKELGLTTCYGTIWNDNFYFISKQDRRIVRVNALSMTDTGSLEILSGADGRAFAGVSATEGVVTTSKGAYVMKLEPLSIGAMLVGTDKMQCGAVYATKDNVFVINQRQGLQIYSVSDNYALVKTHPGVSVGFALAKDGSLWAANGSKLIKINVKTLVVSEIVMPATVTINSSWGAWNPGSLCASATDNVLYFTKSGMWGGGREIYRYVIGDISSLDKVFASSTATDDAFYGSGIGVDPVTGDIVATFCKDGWGDSYKDNRIVTFDGKTGVEKSRATSDYYWFPAMILFNN